MRKSLYRAGEENIAFKHGLAKTKLYKKWGSMKTRCNNPNVKDYPNYGGRGIKVCKEWSDDFGLFYKWAMENGYEDGLTLERKNFNGDYEPNNCCWIPFIAQARNKTQNHFVTINGETKTIVEWSEISGIPPKTLRHRIVNGWSESELLDPVGNRFSHILINGVSKTINAWAKEYQLDHNTIKRRYEKGVRGDALLLPSQKNVIPHKVEINGVSKNIAQWSKESGVARTTITQRYRKGIRGEMLLVKGVKGRRLGIISPILKEK